MNVQAVAKNVRVSPRKVRLVADAIRHLGIDEALFLLQATRKQASMPVAKVLQSAVANATNNAKLERNNLVIASVQVNESQAFKRFHPSTRGRIHPYKKRGSTITIVVKDKVVAMPVTAKKTEVKKVAEKKKGGSE